MSEREAETGGVPPAVTWGLLAAFAVHDLEELATMPGWAAAEVDRLRRRHPKVPERVWATMSVTPGHAATAIGLMGLVVGAASADGARTGGRSPFFQTVLAGFGLHAVSHVAQSAALGRYTPGVVTAPLVVAPFSLWAWRELRRAGVLQEVGTRNVVSGAMMFPLGILGVHLAAFGAGRLARRARAPRRPAARLPSGRLVRIPRRGTGALRPQGGAQP
ncbi:HXXEE domain-containing protein [Streptomyces zingiberis]|uniref:HXXEE domain-containing protein n=1 Tax=Streptomyces zingiberis TaxID=2053010 RepID=A0ABX1BS21_9ACTN|nr:HXXEE domain-containing protein [Streptomyces zingiberis]NJP99012.1 HXXEE domain-containing protein [Streptomyces zingiberis]